MKVEKINDNKARIILTIDELEKRKISLGDIKDGKEKAQDFFFDILEDSDLIEDFQEEPSQLLIEASTNQDDLFMVTITKADFIPDTTKYDKKNSSININNSFSYTVSSSIYRFKTLEDLYLFSKKAYEENSYIGINSLFELDGKYFICFSNSTIKKADFVKTFSILSEYADNYYSKPFFKTSFKEYSNLLIAKSAIQTIQSI